MDKIDWQNIRVAIWSEGLLTRALIEKLRLRYKGITVQIHREVVEGVNNMPSVYAHPEVADFDISFVRRGDIEQILVRCVSRHRLFDYRIDTMTNDSQRRGRFLRFVVEALPGLLGPPVMPEPATPENEENPEVKNEQPA